MFDENFKTVELILVLIIGVVCTFFAGYKRTHRSTITTSSSILLTYYTDLARVIPLDRGVINGLNYQIFNTTADGRRAEDSHDQALLYRVELPYVSNSHLLGIPMNAGAIQLDPSGSGGVMEKVSLEGDYNSYFTIYADKNMKSETQYILDPKAMVFTVDFCQSHNWEIVGSDLYFVQAFGTGSADDNTDMWDDIANFVNEIKPAVSRSISNSGDLMTL